MMVPPVLCVLWYGTTVQGSVRALAGVELGRVHGFGDVVDDLRGVCAHLCSFVLVVERHAHQRLAKRIAIGRIEIEAIVAVRHHTAARVDRHRGLVPFRGRGLPCLAPLRRAARHRPVADRQHGIEAARHVVAADKVMRPAIEVPVDVEVVDRGVRAAGIHERIEVTGPRRTASRRRRSGSSSSCR